MTPEREQYLAGISEKERIARNIIRLRKENIAAQKYRINIGVFKPKAKERLLAKNTITRDRKVISVMKKHLPMKVLEKRYVDSKKYFDGFCPKCLTDVNNKYNLRNCGCCGQVLNWGLEE